MSAQIEAETAAAPLVLASQSASRRTMLTAAGVMHEAVPAHIDERAVEVSLGDAAAPEIARALSVAKAQAVAKSRLEAWVLGSDSLVSVAGRRFDKPSSRSEAGEHLRYFSGRTIELHSAAALVRAGEVRWSVASCAHLVVRDLSEDFIHAYLDEEWPAIAQTVGCFRIEGMGVQLFEGIDGDQFTVLGMPLIEVLGALRDHGVLLS